MANHIPEHKIIIVQAIIFIGLLVLLSLILEGCTDKCDTTRQYVYYEPVFTTSEEVRAAFGFKESQPIVAPGKIYYKEGILFINEAGKGIHVINNRNKKFPQPLGFINIPGNFELAAKGNILFADSYVDLLAIDISDYNNFKILKRVEDIFPHYNSFSYYVTEDNVILTDWKETKMVESVNSDCETGFPEFVLSEGRVGFAMAMDNAVNTVTSSGKAGMGGSMARFTISSNHLYSVDQNNLQVINIANLSDPVPGNKIEIGWGIETIFPYEDKLFVGAQNGMHIFDNSNPDNPVLASTYAHVNSCDPVVVQNDIAYVTLRSGSECQGFTNQLDVLNVENIKNPELIISHPMENPHGLAIDGENLFIAEGKYGLKRFDASNILKINERLMAHMQEVHAFDVIAIDNVIMLIGEDGFYQYDYSNPDKFELLSMIPINRK